MPTDIDISDIGFEWQGRRFTPANPCLFQNKCLKLDAQRWADHAAAWIEILKRYVDAKNKAQVELYNNLIARANATPIESQSAMAWVALAQQAATLTRAFATAFIPVPETGPGWTPQVQLPTPSLPDIPELDVDIQSPLDIFRFPGGQWFVLALLGLWLWSMRGKHG